MEEEMRRVLEYCRWKARWWRARVAPQRAPARGSADSELQEGLRAYALEQEAREQTWVVSWGTKWAAIRERASFVLEERVVDVTEEVLIPLEIELEDDEDARGMFEDDGVEEEEGDEDGDDAE